MGRIFISYRRLDSEDITDRIYEHLSKYFGEDYLFKDVDSIPGGVNFADFIEDSIKSSDAMVVIIGRKWIDATDSKGTRRLDDPTDLVRIELETALTHRIPIVPILVSGSQMPSKEVLPESLQPITTRNAIPVRRDPDFLNDIVRLRRVLLGLINKQGKFRLWPLSKLHIILILLVLTIGGGLGIWWWTNKRAHSTNPIPPSKGASSSQDTATGNSLPYISSEKPNILSANILYRDFQNDPIEANNKYVGKTVVLEGLRGDVVLMSDGFSAAVRIADSGVPNALILLFSDRNDLVGIKRGQKFRFKGTVEKYEYSIVWMENCTIERG